MNGQKTTAKKPTKAKTKAEIVKAKNKAEMDDVKAFEKEMQPMINNIDRNLRAVGY